MDETRRSITSDCPPTGKQSPVCLAIPKAIILDLLLYSLTSVVRRRQMAPAVRGQEPAFLAGDVRRVIAQLTVHCEEITD
jgi:hypothetical protein